jgi:hypothetical protein
MQELGPECLGLEGADVQAENRRPSFLTPMAMIVATETLRPFWRTFT